MLLRLVLLRARYAQLNNSHKACVKFLSNIENGISGNINNGILSSTSNDLVIPAASLTEVLFERFQPILKYKAIECALSGKSYTYEQLRSKSRNFSRFLRKKLNLKQRDVVAVVLSNRPECAIVVLGILEAGLTVTSINPLYTTGEIAKQLLNSSAKAIITQTATYPTVQSATVYNKNSAQIPVIIVKDKQSDSIYQGTIDFDEVANNSVDGPDLAPANPEEIAFLPFSSGTTGLPKSIQLTHGNLVAALYQQCHPDLDYASPTTDIHQEAVIANLPFFHIFGFCTVLINSMARGINLITLPKFIPDKYVEVLRKFQVTFLHVTPPLVLFLTSTSDVKPEYLKHLKYVMCGAAPIGELDEERFLNKFKFDLKIYQGFGMSEACLVATTANKQLQNVKIAGSIGVPVPNTIAKVVDVNDPEGTPLGPHKVGELLIKGPQVMKGYGNAPEQNSKAFLDGWFRTGDLVYYNESGYLYVKDRLKEVIKVKGYQVAPAELEELLRNFHSVEDAAVIGIPHPTFGEVPKAYVVQKNNAVLDTKELEEYVNKNVIKYKRFLGGFEIIDAIPKTVSGKILRRELKEMCLNGNVKSQ